ncbi:early transcribed membrane protein [Plasmodium brasilianum]|uniref:Early transcribed membrane protein n=2 Tax=Plasmodium (Plasmodium) TaxID=418103 RepID=A0A1A8WS64_PLAMA|nr:early transcribed membrane protein [Plasmodium malariae]KAI4840181.1 early transcribed membrane protein [Plasmodium brasilianum]SBS95772.1 early transcribed membrane protein [Plasmodium malariae]SBT87542.1 early transcribed membrane protein [Plasmodium malariae]
MKLTRVFYIIAFLLTIKILVPGFNNVEVEAKNPVADAKSVKKVDDDIQRKQRNQKILLISSVATSVAIILGSLLGGLGYYKQKKIRGGNVPAAPVKHTGTKLEGKPSSDDTKLSSTGSQGTTTLSTNTSTGPSKTYTNSF